MNVHTKELEDLGLAQGPSAAMQRVLERLPAELRAGFTTEQITALDAALDANNPTHHPINLRLTLFGQAYLVILGGREQRSPERRAAEREQHPLSSPGNVAFLCAVAFLSVILGYALRLLLPGA